jgi:hypothetical protein
MKHNGLKTSFGGVDKKAPGSRTIFFLSQLMQKITSIRTKLSYNITINMTAIHIT